MLLMDPEDLLPYYERELTLLRRSMHHFADSFPKIAARLSIAGEHSDDPHIERMLESAALLNAGLSARIQDDVPEFTRALMESVHGAFLRSFPSCSIAQFRPEKIDGRLAIPRGALFTTLAGEFTFCSTADVILAPLEITAVRHGPPTLAPADARLPGDTSALLSITYAPLPKAALSEAPDTVRIYLAGQREIAAAIGDSVLLHATRAYVEIDGDGRWKRLPRVPLASVGFDDADRLVRGPDAAAQAIAPIHLLMEYCAFPERFDFLDLDMAQLRRTAGPCDRITLHLAVAGVHPDSVTGQRLAEVSAEHLQLFCTPVTNLFPSAAVPIETIPGVAHYPLKPFEAPSTRTQIWAVESVRQQTAGDRSNMPPFHSLQHGFSASDPASAWMMRRGDGIPVPSRPNGHAELLLVERDGRPADPGTRDLTIDLLCTNGDLPATRTYGNPGGDLALKDGAVKCPITLLRPPTTSRWPTFRYGELWEMLSLFLPHASRLGPGGIEEIRQLCRRFTARSGASGQPFDGLVSLHVDPTTRWMPLKPSPAFVRGLEVTLTLDETLFTGRSLSTLIHVMDRVFAPYAPANSFVQLVAVSATAGALIRRCPLRTGGTPLV